MQKKSVTELIIELAQRGISEQVAWWLLEKLSQKTKIELILLSELNISTQNQTQLDIWVDQIMQTAKPVQYILGDINFLGLKILVEPPILIPRPETEEWCAAVIKQLKKDFVGLASQESTKPGLKILDLCAGTGCIGLALARALPDVQVWAVEINSQACELIEKNKLINKVNNLTVINLDLNKLNLSNFSGFDVITANPPYITSLEYLDLAPNVQAWEDPRALVSGIDGLDLIRQIINLAMQIKTKILYLEIGYLQAELVTKLAQAAGFKTIIVHRDMYGKNRMLEIRLV